MLRKLSDHYMVYAVHHHKTNHRQGDQQHLTTQYRSFKNFNQYAYEIDLQSADWSTVYNAQTTDEAWDNLHSILKTVKKEEEKKTVNKYAPLKERRIQAQNVPWIDDIVLSSMRLRDRLLRKCHASKAEQDLNVFKKQRKFVVNLVNRTKAEYFKTTIEENRFHPKALWSTFKQILPGSKAELPSRVKSNDGESFHTTPIVNHFNNFFAAIGNKLIQNMNHSDPNISIPRCAPLGSKFNIPDMSQCFLEKEIKSMPLGKATGMDGISIKILKISCNQILAPLLHTINLSFNTSNVPSAWKAAKVIPVYKAGDCEDTNKYRPISVLTVVSKIVERYFLGLLCDFLNDLNLITACQSCHSTATALVKIYNDFLKGFDNENFVGAVFNEKGV